MIKDRGSVIGLWHSNPCTMHHNKRGTRQRHTSTPMLKRVFAFRVLKTLLTKWQIRHSMLHVLRRLESPWNSFGNRRTSHDSSTKAACFSAVLEFYILLFSLSNYKLIFCNCFKMEYKCIKIFNFSSKSMCSMHRVVSYAGTHHSVQVLGYNYWYDFPLPHSA